jgi:hypothetical protein
MNILVADSQFVVSMDLQRDVTDHAHISALVNLIIENTFTVIVHDFDAIQASQEVGADRLDFEFVPA